MKASGVGCVGGAAVVSIRRVEGSLTGLARKDYAF
jgi:hypothetical protein